MKLVEMKMLSKSFLLLCVALAVCHAKHVVPRGIAEEVQEELDALQNLVEGDIFVAHDELRLQRSDFLTYSGDTSTTGIIGIQQEAEAIYAQLNTLRQLGDAAGIDVTPCFEENEVNLRQLGQDSVGNLTDCVAFIDREARRLLDRSTYVIDISINNVHRIQDQVDRCAGDIQCLSPLISEIALDKIRLPQNIRTEVDAARVTLSTLRGSVDNCVSERETDYIQQATGLVTLISNCVDGLLS